MVPLVLKTMPGASPDQHAIYELEPALAISRLTVRDSGVISDSPAGEARCDPSDIAARVMGMNE